MLKRLPAQILLTLPTFFALMFVDLLGRSGWCRATRSRCGAASAASRPSAWRSCRHELGLDQPVWKQFPTMSGSCCTAISAPRSSPTAGADRVLRAVPGDARAVALRHALRRRCSACRPASSPRVKRGSWFDQTLMGTALTGYLDADLLVGPAADHAVLRQRWGWTPVSGRIDLSTTIFEPVTGFMLIDSAALGPEGRVLVGAAPPDPADDRARHHPARRDRAHDALVHARGAGRGLRAHRPRQGPVAVPRRRLHALRNALIPVVTIDRPAGRHAAGRRGADRDDLLLAGHRQVADRVDRPARLSRAAGRHAADRRMVIVVNLIVDLLYGVINPRIRHGR